MANMGTTGISFCFAVRAVLRGWARQVPAIVGARAVREVHLIGLEPTVQLYNGSYVSARKSCLASFNAIFFKHGVNGHEFHPLRLRFPAGFLIGSPQIWQCRFTHVASLGVKDEARPRALKSKCLGRRDEPCSWRL